MSVYISGMDMPVCHFKTSESYNVHGFWMVYPDGKSKLHIMVGSDHWVCEAIPVPDHGRLGDLDAFESIKYELPNGPKAFNRGFHSGVQYVQRLIMDAPTVIPSDPADEGEG